MNSFEKITTVGELHSKFDWFDYNNIDNVESMSGDELLNSELAIKYDADEDVCTIQFPIGGHVCEPFGYHSGSDFDRECITALSLI